MTAEYLKLGHGRFRPRVSNSLFKDKHRPLFINKPFGTTMEHATHMSKSCTVTLVAALTTSRCDRSATGWRSEASGSRGVWMTSWWVLESASPSAAWVYFNSRSRRPPSATHKRQGHLTTLYHLRNVVSRSFSIHQFVCNSTVNGDCIERKRRSIKNNLSTYLAKYKGHSTTRPCGHRQELQPIRNLGDKRGCGWSAPRLLYPVKDLIPIYRRLSGPRGPSERVRKISSPPGFNPQVVQP